MRGIVANFSIDGKDYQFVLELRIFGKFKMGLMEVGEFDSSSHMRWVKPIKMKIRCGTHWEEAKDWFETNLPRTK